MKKFTVEGKGQIFEITVLRSYKGSVHVSSAHLACLHIGPLSSPWGSGSRSKKKVERPHVIANSDHGTGSHVAPEKADSGQPLINILHDGAICHL